MTANELAALIDRTVKDLDWYLFPRRAKPGAFAGIVGDPIQAAFEAAICSMRGVTPVQGAVKRAAERLAPELDRIGEDLTASELRRFAAGVDADDDLDTARPVWRSIKPQLQLLAMRLLRQLRGEQGPQEPKPRPLSSPRAMLPPAREKAYGQFLHAVQRNSALNGATDREVYDWLADNLKEGDKLPSFATWAKYLRDARKAHDANKYTFRAGRTGRSIVNPDQI